LKARHKMSIISKFSITNKPWGLHIQAKGISTLSLIWQLVLV